MPRRLSATRYVAALWKVDIRNRTTQHQSGEQSMLKNILAAASL
ncbi:hypothetical protein OF001_U10035 [Pseudomonas sp. OF001]|nr:hypothetical protein OF001_U10035 [Pseudomonas sp. OF001]